MNWSLPSLPLSQMSCQPTTIPGRSWAPLSASVNRCSRSCSCCYSPCPCCPLTSTCCWNPATKRRVPTLLPLHLAPRFWWPHGQDFRLKYPEESVQEASRPGACIKLICISQACPRSLGVSARSGGEGVRPERTAPSPALTPAGGSDSPSSWTVWLRRRTADLQRNTLPGLSSTTQGD